jgi:hypothetical protein
MASIINATTSTGLVSSADNSGSLQLATNSGTTAVTIDTSQNVLAGGTTAIDGGVGVQVGNTSAGNAKSTLQLLGNTNSWVQFGNGLSGASRYLGWVQYNYASNYMTFATDSTERMRITSTGQLGLGVTPSAWGGTFKALQIGRGSYSADGTGNLQVTMNAYYDGSDWKYISANRASNIYADLSGSINTRTTNTVGTVDGSVSWTTGPYIAAGGTSWTNSSDANLKNITGEIDDALNKVNQLRAAKFTWKADADNKAQVGLIAQDLQNVLPEAVVVPEKEIDSEGNPTFLGVNYDQVIPLLVASIKELNAKVEAQALEIQALKGVA